MVACTDKNFISFYEQVLSLFVSVAGGFGELSEYPIKEAVEEDEGDKICNISSHSFVRIPNNVKETQDAENEKPRAVKATRQRLRPAWLKDFYTG
ncbi:hypothetical protein MA16_Dca013919 [Dendrobium catenatum]|uniref:Uncharacterized protein n=1 Tax=Dendrobium catenatum TaxID=906689 RepID=A0A2I0WCU8_9ASPA|nr:hypothetical protein MA16_Dca013919 [Dendrobium catenatum]